MVGNNNMTELYRYFSTSKRNLPSSHHSKLRMASTWYRVSLSLPVPQQTLLNDHSLLSRSAEMQRKNPSEHSVPTATIIYQECLPENEPHLPFLFWVNEVCCVSAQVPPDMASAAMLSCFSFWFQTHLFGDMISCPKWISPPSFPTHQCFFFSGLTWVWIKGQLRNLVGGTSFHDL